MRLISILVEDKPGVMSRIADIFRRQLVNIDTITVGRTEMPGVSRITITLSDAVSELITYKIAKKIEKTIDVIKVDILDPKNSVLRELALVKVRTEGFERRNEVLQLVEIFRANVVDVSPVTLTIQVVGDVDKIEAFLELISRYEIVELCRTGVVAIARGEEGIVSRERKESIRESMEEESRYHP